MNEPRDPTESELMNMAVDAYLYDCYQDIDLIQDLIVVGKKDIAEAQLIRNFRLAFFIGAIEQAKNPNLILNLILELKGLEGGEKE